MLTILQGDALSMLKTLEDESVQCCVCSPPYWGLRDYGLDPLVWDNHNGCEHKWELYLQPSANGQTTHAMIAETLNESSATRKPKLSNFCECGAWRGCLGLEPSPELYVRHLVEILAEVKRVLKAGGTLWLNLGDSYAGSWGNYHPNSPPGKHGQRLKETARWNRPAYSSQEFLPPTANCPGLKPKDLVGVPWMAAFALRADGWYLRSDIIWAKANCMPESVTDRPTRSHEYIFLLSKSARYFYNHEAIKEPAIYDVDGTGTAARKARAHEDLKSHPTKERAGIRPAGFKDAAKMNGKHGDKQRGHSRRHAGFNDRWDHMERVEQCTGMRNKRDVWNVAPAIFPEAHFATYPPALITPCILAGSKTGDVVLDPFAGSGTTGKVAIELGRKAILIEPKAEYVEMIERRCRTTIGLPFTQRD